MLRPALATTAVLVARRLAGRLRQAAAAAAAAQVAYVPPPLPEPPAAPWCARPAEITAFSVAALKSDLMVAAVSCQADEKYNAFVTRYRPSLVAAEKTTESYFSRNDKRRWQQARDDYITQLANAQSQRAMVLGSQFCATHAGPVRRGAGADQARGTAGLCRNQDANDSAGHEVQRMPPATAGAGEAGRRKAPPKKQS